MGLDANTSACCSEVTLKQEGWRLGISDLELSGERKGTLRYWH